MIRNVAYRFRRHVTFRHVAWIVRMLGDVAQQLRMGRYEAIRRRIAVFRSHQFRIVRMRLDVAQAERVIRHITERLRLRLVERHEIRVFRMTRNIASIMRMAGYGTDGSSNGFSVFRMSEFRIIWMAREVAEQHRMTRNGAQWQFVFRSFRDWLSSDRIRRRTVDHIIRIVWMFRHVARVVWMSRYIANGVLQRSGKSRIAIFRIVRMADKVAENARMARYVDVADRVDFGRWAS